MTDQPGGDADQPVPQGGDHGLAVADTVPEQAAVGGGGGGELVQPAGEAGGEQRAPHPRPVDLGISRGQVAQRGAVLGVAEQVLHLGAVAVPVLDRGGALAGGDVEVGHDERVAVHGVQVSELGQGQGTLVGVQGAAPPGPRIRRHRSGGHVEADAADQQPGRGGPPVRAVVGDGDLGAGHVDRVGPVGIGDAVQQPPQRGDPPGPDGELDPGEQGGAGQLPGEVAGIGAHPDPPARAGAGSAASDRRNSAGASGRGSSFPASRSAASTVAVSAQVATCGRRPVGPGGCRPPRACNGRRPPRRWCPDRSSRSRSARPPAPVPPQPAWPARRRAHHPARSPPPPTACRTTAAPARPRSSRTTPAPESTADQRHHRGDGPARPGSPPRPTARRPSPPAAARRYGRGDAA